MNPFADLIALWRELGPLRFTLFVGGTLAIVAVFAATFTLLADSIGWPDAYGFTCRRKCLIEHMWHSHKLLARGTGAELALFALIWFVPFVAAAYALPIVFRRWLKRHRNRIRPQRPE